MRRTLRTRVSSPTDLVAAMRAQLDRAEAQLSAVRQQLRQTQQLASLGTAAAMLAHEFNNLMTPVVAYAQHALETGDDSLRIKALQVTLRQTALLTAMSDRIVSLASNTPLEQESENLRAIVDEAVASQCRDLAKDGISLKIVIDESTTVWADAKQLQQVFFNLILNSRRALDGAQGRITITAESMNAGRVRVAVEDTGCGMPSEQIDHIFEPFFTSKGNGAKPTGSITGLGLTICRDIVLEHGGTISASSVQGEGTTFTIDLPTRASD